MTECSCYTPVQFAIGYVRDKNQVQFDIINLYLGIHMLKILLKVF